MAARSSFAVSVAVAALAAGPLSLVGCAAEDTDDPDLGSESDAILGGRRSTKAQDAVVWIGTKHQGGTGLWFAESRCTGTLVAPNVVLTALHCLGTPNHRAYTGSSRRRGSSTCDSGVQTGAKGDYVLESAKHFVVKVSADLRGAGYQAGTAVFPLDRLAPEAGVRAFVLPKNHCLLGSDVAALVLDRPINGVATAKIRAAKVRAGEPLVAVGWGFTGDRLYTDNTLVRRQRPGVTLDVAGPRDFATDPFDFDHRVAATELRLAERGVSCFGDSGGALLDADGALVGVISRGDDAVCSRGLTIAGSAAAYRTLVDEAIAQTP